MLDVCITFFDDYSEVISNVKIIYQMMTDLVIISVTGKSVIPIADIIDININVGAGAAV